MTDFILHQYDLSPFALKARMMFGLKGVSWQAVEIPNVMPKPDLMPLTGGYRRTPVMQIGADIYCDTQRIAVEVERRAPEPTLFPAGGAGFAAMITRWSDDMLFRPSVNYAFSHIADKLPPGLLEDRAAMRSAPPPDIGKFMAMAPKLEAEMAPLLQTVESLFADGRDYATGADAPGLADLSLYHPLWMLAGAGRKVSGVLEPYEKTRAWMERMAGIGEGDRSALDSKAALKIAQDTDPAPLPGESQSDFASPEVGDRVSVMSADKVPPAVEGEVVYITPTEITLRREDDQVGTLHQHFPRAGYLIAAA